MALALNSHRPITLRRVLRLSSFLSSWNDQNDPDTLTVMVGLIALRTRETRSDPVEMTVTRISALWFDGRGHYRQEEDPTRVTNAISTSSSHQSAFPRYGKIWLRVLKHRFWGFDLSRAVGLGLKRRITRTSKLISRLGMDAWGGRSTIDFFYLILDLLIKNVVLYFEFGIIFDKFFYLSAYLAFFFKIYLVLKSKS